MPTGLFDDQLMSDTAYSPVADSSLISPPRSGLGLSNAPPTISPPTLPPVRGRVDDDLKNLPPMGKLGLALQSFGAGITGRPNPIDTMMKQKREERLMQMNEFRAHLLALEDGIKMSDRLRDPDRRAFADSYAARLDQVSPGLGDTFKALHKRPDISKMLGKYSDIPMAQMSLAADPSGQGFLKMLSTTDGMKLAEKQLDMKALPIVTEKVKSIYKNWQQLVSKEMADKFNEDGVLSESEVLKANDYIKEKFPKLALDDAQLEVLRRNSKDVFMPMGILTAGSEQEIAKRRLEAKDKLQPGQIVDIPLGGKNFAKGAYDPDKTLFPNAAHDANGFAILGKGTKEGTTINMPSSAGFGVNPDTGKPGHYTIGRDGGIRWDKVEPLPKPVDPLKKAIGDAINGPTGAAPKAAASLPPEITSKLKPGVNTTLSDGSVWTLESGKPKKVR